ncbi:MAG: MFS transporter [Leptonema sp. (in: bacteria)]
MFFSKREKKILLLGLFLSLFLAALDQTIISTASPAIIKSFNQMENYFWITTSYLLSSVIVLPIFGRLCDIMSIKTLILISNFIFLIGSFLCALSANIIQLSLFRFIQGIGGGGIFAITFSTIGFLYPPKERGEIQGWIASIFGISSILGPLLGSFLTSILSWHWIFFINIPIGILALFIIQTFFPKISTISNHRFDILGSALFIIGTLSLLSMLNFEHLSIEVKIVLFLMGILFFLWFYKYENKIEHPLFDFKLFKDSTFFKSGIATFFLGGTFISVLIFFPLYLTEKYKINSLKMGNLISLITLGIVISSTISGKISSITGKYKRILLFSNLWLIFVFFVLFFISYFYILQNLEIFFMILVGIGFGPILPLYIVAVQNSVSKKRLGTATSSIQFLRQLGASTGSSLLGSIYHYFVFLYSEKGILLYFPCMMFLNSLFVFIGFLFTLNLPDLNLRKTHID